ncbi:MAG: T9SS type A sorting domain-containing protein [Saprospiraceae bacterium]|nr:T9SS type A sorting domain-containing protein [Saprospiraceae bacterium]
MKHLLALFIPLFTSLNPALSQTLTIGNGATVHVNRNGSNTATPMIYVMGALQNDGTLSEAGSVQTTSSFTNNSVFTAHLGGATLGVDYDQLNVAGSVVLNGTLTVVLANGYTPTSGTSFTIIDGTSLSGAFSSYNFPTLSGSLTWSIGYNGSAGTVILTVTTVLPVELLNFKAESDIAQHQVLLNWSTSVEENTKSFIVERSRDGQNFIPLSTHKAKGSNSIYDDIDKQPFAGVNYYRLKMIDNDGKASYSKVIAAIMGDKTFKIKAYPTLVTDELTVTTDGGEINSLEIINLAGQLVLSQQNAALSQNGAIQLSLSDLPQSAYILRAKNTEGVVATLKFVKQ